MDNNKDCRCPLNSNLGYEGKVAMVSWVESAESYIFQTKEILMARHPTFVLRKLTCTKITICCQGHLSQERIMQVLKENYPWFGFVDHFDALVPDLKDASRPLASFNPTSHLVHSLEKSSIVFERCCKLR